MARQSIVADYMVRDVISVEPDMTVKEVSEKIRSEERRVGKEC